MPITAWATRDENDEQAPREGVGDSHGVVRRYALFQLPELVLVSLALGVALEMGWLSRSLTGVLGGLWLLKEVVLFPFVRSAYEPSDPSATQRLIGRMVVVTAALSSSESTGYVRMGGELWRARLAADEASAEVGSEVCVRSVEGVTLIVAPETKPID